MRSTFIKGQGCRGCTRSSLQMATFGADHTIAPGSSSRRRRTSFMPRHRRHIGQRHTGPENPISLLYVANQLDRRCRYILSHHPLKIAVGMTTGIPAVHLATQLSSTRFSDGAFQPSMITDAHVQCVQYPQNAAIRRRESGFNLDLLYQVNTATNSACTVLLASYASRDKGVLVACKAIIRNDWRRQLQPRELFVVV